MLPSNTKKGRSKEATTTAVIIKNQQWPESESSSFGQSLNLLKPEITHCYIEHVRKYNRVKGKEDKSRKRNSIIICALNALRKKSF